MGLMEKIFGDINTKEVKKVEKIADQVMALEDQMAALTDEELKAKTPEFKERLANGETLDDLLPEAFAVCREAAWRSVGMKHFKVQVLGGIVLHQGRIAEMKTGEGKTLVATLPTYLNALMASQTRPARLRTGPILLTEPTTNSALIICGITWSFTRIS